MSKLAVLTVMWLLVQLTGWLPASVGEPHEREGAESNIPTPDPINIPLLERRFQDAVRRKATYDSVLGRPLSGQAKCLRPSFYVGFARTAAALYLAQTRAGQPDEKVLCQAVEAIQVAMEYGPERTRGMLAVAFGHLVTALSNQGRLEEATRWQEAVVSWEAELWPSSGGPLFHLAVLQLQLGRESAAAGTLQRVLQTDRKEFDVFELLRDVQIHIGDEDGAKATAKEALLFGVQELRQLIRSAETTRVLRRRTPDGPLPRVKFVPTDDKETAKQLLTEGWDDVSDEVWQGEVERLTQAVVRMFRVWRGSEDSRCTSQPRGSDTAVQR